MPFLILLLGFLLSAGLVLAFMPLVRRFALRAGLVDRPDGIRKLHKEPIPCIGGLAIAGAFFAGAAAMTLAWVELPSHLVAMITPPPVLVVLGALLIAAVGFADDILDLSFRHKFAAQLAATGLAVAGGYRITVFDVALGDGTFALGVSFVLTVVWMVGVMNAVNLIDGADGLAAGVVAVAMVGLAAVHAAAGDIGALVLPVALVGALVGFLRYNWNPASVFMGDAGSLLLGYIMASYALRGTAHADPVLALIIPAVVMGVPVLDTLLSIVRRRLTGRGLFAADKDHIHHRLIARTGSVRRAVGLLIGLGVFLSVGAFAMVNAPRGTAYAIFLGGTGLVYLFLRVTGALPTLRDSARLVRRRAALRRVLRLKDLAAAQAVVPAAPVPVAVPIAPAVPVPALRSLRAETAGDGALAPSRHVRIQVNTPAAVGE